MEMILIKTDSGEWNRMWDELASHPLNEGIEEPSLAVNEGEAWQYIGSYRQDKRIIHEFRHNLHPKYNQKEYLKFNSSELISDEDIQSAIPFR